MTARPKKVSMLEAGIELKAELNPRTTKGRPYAGGGVAQTERQTLGATSNARGCRNKRNRP